MIPQIATGILAACILAAAPAAAESNAERTQAQVQRIKDLARDSTSVQWDATADQLRGTPVHWSGWIADVREKRGAYEASIDVDPPDVLVSTPEIHVPISRRVAVGLRKDQPVVIDGQIERVARPLGMVIIYMARGTSVR